MWQASRKHTVKRGICRKGACSPPCAGSRRALLAAEVPSGIPGDNQQSSKISSFTGCISPALCLLHQRAVSLLERSHPCPLSTSSVWEDTKAPGTAQAMAAAPPWSCCGSGLCCPLLPSLSRLALNASVQRWHVHLWSSTKGSLGCSIMQIIDP